MLHFDFDQIKPKAKQATIFNKEFGYSKNTEELSITPITPFSAGENIHSQSLMTRNH